MYDTDRGTSGHGCYVLHVIPHLVIEHGAKVYCPISPQQAACLVVSQQTGGAMKRITMKRYLSLRAWAAGEGPVRVSSRPRMIQEELLSPGCTRPATASQLIQCYKRIVGIACLASTDLVIQTDCWHSLPGPCILM